MEILYKDADALPISIWCYARRGIRRLNHEQTLRFIRDRIEPSGRMNISDFLCNAGLAEYDDWMLFLFHHGKTVRDKLYITPEQLEGTRFAAR